MVRFPFAVFLRFLAVQLVVFNALFAAAFALVISGNDLTAAHFWPVFGVFFAGSVIAAAVTSWRFTRPIRSALEKVLRIASKKYAKVTGDRDESDLLSSAESGGYSELVTALNRIDKKLKKRKEQLLREREENAAFMSSVQEGLISIDPVGRLRYFNSKFAALFLPQGFEKSEEGVRLIDVIRAPEISESFRRVVETGELRRVDVRLSTRLDHQPRDFSVLMSPLRNDSTGEIRGVIGIFHDVTDLKRTERIRIDFVGNASHELRTPLTSIKGYLETVKEDFRTGRLDEVGPFLGVISSNVDRLIELVNDLLSLSALEHGSELRLESVNALAITDQVVKTLSKLAAEKDQVIRVLGDVEPFQADARKVEQVLHNLVSNAIKYVPSGKQIRIEWSNGPRGEVVLKVIDDGPGIPEEHHARLFERFYRIDKGRSRDAGGTGLGLAIVKHIMQSHGGSVVMKSRLGEGSEFICTFPRLKDNPGHAIR